MPDDPALAAAFADRDAHEADFRSAVAVRVGQLATDRDDALSKASTAVIEQNRLLDMVTQRDATITQLRQQASSGAVQWTPQTVFAAGGTYDVPPNQPVAIVVPPNAPGVTLRLTGPNWPQGSDPAITLLADDCEVRGKKGVTTFAAPASVPDRPDGRLGVDECIRVGAEVPTGVPVRNTRVTDVSAGRVDAYAKCYPDADGVLFDRPVTTTDLRADGVFSGGAKNITIRDPSLTAKNENTVRATVHRGALSRNMRVIGGSVSNTGGKAACDPRNCDGFYVGDAVLSATGNNAAVGVGNSGPTDPGAKNVTVERCTMPSGGLAVNNRAAAVAFLNNHFAWQTARDNVAISVNAKGNLDGITIIGNSGESPVTQKPMVGYGSGKREDVKNLVEQGNGWRLAA